MGKRTWAFVTAAVLVVVAGGAGVWWWRTSQERERDELSRAAVNAFAQAWQSRSFQKAGVRFTGSTPEAVAKDFTNATSGLGSSPVTVDVESVRRDGTTADAVLKVTWNLFDSTPWSYQAQVSVAETPEGWAVRPETGGSLWHPRLGAGEALKVTRTPGERGDLLDREGEPLMPLGKVYPVQLDPSRATAATARSLEKIVDEPAGSLVAKLAAAQKAGSKAPIAVITYRQSDFDARRARLDALKGVIYPARQQPLARSRSFGQPLLGSYGQVSAELIEKGEGRYAAGDFAGTSGLQGQYDRVLGGTPGISVASSGKPDTPLFEKAGTPGEDVQLTLSPSVQEAAEKALAGTGAVPSALVAIDVPTGDVLAAANSPAFGFDRAITGRYPPGSTFKVASTYALLSQGAVTPSTPVSCPKTYVVDGRTIRNYESGSLANPLFADDFANSCNTAFVQLAEKLGNGDLAAGARALGIGAGWEKTVGVNGAFAGSIPENTGATDKAAATIGQGRNLTSPLALAVMAGSVARGSAIAPALVTKPAPEDGARDPKALDPEVTSQLRSLMGLVVTEGSAEVLRNVPGGVVRGKTGTAEHGTKNPPETHAWFVGYQGDVAFAVLVETGKSGGTVAAPVAKAFLTNLAR
jgi:cell division protein FtsI/penicillin-binding protein 2